MSDKYCSSVGIKKRNVFTFEGRILRATALKISEVLLKSEGGEVTLTPEPSCSIHKESPKKAQSASHKTQTQHLAIIFQRENGLVCKSALALFLLFSSDDEFGSKEL